MDREATLVRFTLSGANDPKKVLAFFYLRRRKIEIPVPLKVYERNWDKISGRVKRGAPNWANLNKRLDECRFILGKAADEALQKGLDPAEEYFSSRLSVKREKKKSFIEHFIEYLASNKISGMHWFLDAMSRRSAVKGTETTFEQIDETFFYDVLNFVNPESGEQPDPEKAKGILKRFIQDAYDLGFTKKLLD